MKLSSERHRRARWLAAVGTVGLTFAAALPAYASHADWTNAERHLRTIHWNTIGHGANDEDYCVQSDGSGGYSSASAGERIHRTLTVDAPHWDGLGPHGDWRIDLYKADLPCGSYSDRSWVEIEYWVQNSTPCGVNCAYAQGPIWEGGHSHYKWYVIYLRPLSNGMSQLMINHETGHAFGLLDPGDVDGEAVVPCQKSIMHIPYESCGGWTATPTQSDFDKVKRLMDQA